MATLAKAAKTAAAGFGAKEMRDFDPRSLKFSLDLMKDGGLDPRTYAF
jgi:hypothetical protein